MKKYIFIGNSSKPDKKKYESLETMKTSNVCKHCLQIAHSMGYDVFLGINRKYPDKIETDMPFKVNLYESHTYRSIFAFKDNYIAYKNLNKVLKENKISVIHCNTPIGGFIGRVCGKKNKVNKIIYTAHGFHFFKGNSWIKNFIFRNIERILAKKTDAIITMNQEDYDAAQRFKLKKGGKVYFTHGVGVNLEEYDLKINKSQKRKELGLLADDIVLISMGDLVKRKNYSLALDVIAKLNNPKIKYLICGKGRELEILKEQAIKLGISDQVIFLGFRTDIRELLKISDIFFFTSLQEGLPRSTMEAMASGLPCVVSNIRGNIDLIDNDKGGYCCNEIDEYVNDINKIINNKKLRNDFVKYNLEKIKNYSYDNVKCEIEKIYKDIGL